MFAATLMSFFGLTSCERPDDNPPIIPTLGETGGGFDQDGASTARFSVSDIKQVRFSRGNLQYQASTDTWRFAVHQYDYIGADNANISSTYGGWIDLFGWGTSGWNSGAICYQPWSTSTNSSDYFPGGDYTNNLYGDYANADWGVYNAISNGGNRAGLWRTLTTEEWIYLINTRANASSKYGFAVIDGRYKGLIILPDIWKIPDGLTFVSGDDNQNEYTLEQWSQMESAGALFLPAAGIRYGTGLDVVGHEGRYWSSSYRNSSIADNLGFNVVDLNCFAQAANWYWVAISVRLVMD